MDFLPIFTKMAELFLIIIIGYVATRFKIITPTAKKAISKVIINIAMPCTMLASVMNSSNLPSKKEIVLLMFVSFSTYVVLFILAKLVAKILRVSGPQKGAVEFGIMFANVGFIGFPVSEAIWGSDAIFYTSVFNMPFNLLCYSLGIAMVSGVRITRNDEGEKEDRKTIIRKLVKLLVTPAMLGAIACIIMGFTKYQGHDFFAETFTTLGGITTPGALLVIGASLAEMPFKEMFTNVKAYLFTIFAVVVTPLVMYFIYKPFIGDMSLLFGETVVISAMPVATAGTMLCVEYGGDEKFMAQITFITTLVTVITIPIIAILI